MALRRHLVIVCISALCSMGASFRTANFVVDAPTPQIAQQIGQYAEHYRQEKAMLWLGREMPPWPEPCPLKVTVQMSGAGGATSFAFDNGRILKQNMHIEGSLDRLLASVLPHEITHTVFAHYFRCPVPRWSDEGGAVLSEDDAERNRHDRLCRDILNTPGRAIPLRRLFALREYPSDVMALYAQGFSVVNFLVAQSNRQAFLAFIAQGMQEGWDKACQVHYRYKSVDELEQAWLQKLRDTRRQPEQLAQAGQPPAPQATPAPQAILVRQTAPPVQPVLAGASAIYRGQSSEPDGLRLGEPVSPNTMPPAPAMPENGWRPVPPNNPAPQVQLGPPLFGPVPSAGYRHQ